MAEEIAVEETEIKTDKAGDVKEVKTIVAASSEDGEHFEKHLYDCPNCHKKVKINLEGCGCPPADDIYSFAIGHI